MSGSHYDPRYAPTKGWPGLDRPFGTNVLEDGARLAWLRVPFAVLCVFYPISGDRRTIAFAVDMPTRYVSWVLTAPKVQEK